MKPQRKKIKPLERDNKVYMPVKESNAKPLPKRNNGLFKKIEKKIPKPSRRKPLKLPKLSLYIILVILFLGISYLSVIYINKLRNTENKNNNTVYVMGLTSIPAYPNSTFIFQDSLNEDSVKNFLSKGGSAYRLPNNVSITDVFGYYKEKLPSLGWNFVQEVSLEQEDKEYGQYWTKDNVGLRIYSKFDDVWYETITTQEAQSGLSEKVQAENNLQLLLANTDAQDLLPDFPWILTVPNEYLISYSASTFDATLEQVAFSKIGTTEIVNLVPICKSDKEVLDNCLSDYAVSLSASTGESWTVNGTSVISTNVGNGIEGNLKSGADTREVAVIGDSYNNIGYVIDSNVMANPFVDYILSNIQTQNTKKY